MGRQSITFDQFEEFFLVSNYCDGKGKPKHTRFIKKLFYRFANELMNKYGFNMHKCLLCGIEEWNGRSIVMELDHINRIINDSRIKNLRALCPNCHSQTDGYKNRASSVCEYVMNLKESATNG